MSIPKGIIELCVECQYSGFCAFQTEQHSHNIPVIRHCFLFKYDPPEREGDWMDAYQPWWKNPILKRGDTR